MTPELEFALMNNLDLCITSVHYSVIKFYVNLNTAAIHEKYSIDIPYGVKYTAVSNN